ncbi:hypothetical protein V6Z12_A11G017600 [Gossypium hirsutum]
MGFKRALPFINSSGSKRGILSMKKLWLLAILLRAFRLSWNLLVVLNREGEIYLNTISVRIGLVLNCKSEDDIGQGSL